MRCIDFHTHVFPDELAASAVSSLAEDGGVHPSYDGTASGLLDAMSRSGVAASVIQPVATKPSQVRRINEWAATLHSDRLVPFGAMHPDLEEPAAEFERMRAAGIIGFKMHPEYQAFAPDEPRMRPIFEAAARHRMIAFFHAGGDIACPTVRGTAVAFAAVLDAHTDLTLVLAHMGGFELWSEVAAVLAGRDVWFDTAFCLGHLPDAEFVDLVRAHGAGRVLFGSDGPWADTALEIEKLRSCGLDEAELDAILGGNAQRLLAARA